MDHFGARAIHSFHPPGSLSSLDSKLRHSDFTLLIYRVGSMRLDRFNVWGSGRSGHVSGSRLSHIDYAPQISIASKFVGPAEISWLS